MSSSTISILFFGQITELTGVTSLELTGLKDTDSVVHHLKALYPQLDISLYQIALDREIIHENVILTSNHTLALLPPYAGG